MAKNVGPPEYVALDEATALQSDYFESKLSEYGIRIASKAVEARRSFVHAKHFHYRICPVWAKTADQAVNLYLSKRTLL